jgi:NitT/TauT family transport system substrate-binding protein
MWTLARCLQPCPPVLRLRGPRTVLLKGARPVLQLPRGANVRIRRQLACVGLVGISLAACSSSTTTASPGPTSASTPNPSSTQPSAPSADTAVTVGTAPNLANASLYLAVQDGTFKANHLSVTPQVVTSGAQAVPLLLNGQIQFTASDPTAAIAAIAKGVPIIIVAQGSVAPVDAAKDSTGLLVSAASTVSSVTQLSGKTIAVNALGSQSQIGIARTIDAAGGDSSKVKFVAFPAAQMEASLAKGTVDATVDGEPFLTQAVQDGQKDISPVLSSSMPGAPTIVYLAATSYVAKNPAVVNAFVASMNKANTTLSTNADLIRSVGAKSTTTSAAVLAKVRVPTFVATPIDINAMEALEKLMVSYKVLSAPIDVQKCIYQAS